MIDLVVDTTLPPLAQEGQVLNWFRDSGVTNPKKLVKMAKKIHGIIPEFISRSITHNVLIARYPAKFLAEAYREMDDYPVIIAGLIADGNHGMLLHNDNIYGLVVNTKWSSWMEGSQRWNSDQEAEIQDELLDSWMEENIIRHFDGRMVLFREFGFTGMARKMVWTMTDDCYDNLKATRNTIKNLEKLVGDL